THFAARQVGGSIPMKYLAVSCALWLAVSPALAAPRATSTQTAAATTIRVGDTLDIQVAGETGLSKSYTVDAAGRITLDMVGPTRVAWRHPDKVADFLRANLGRYLTMACDKVGLTTPLRQEILVTGEVAHPGAVKLRPGDALLDALGAAGGLNPNADGSRAT